MTDPTAVLSMIHESDLQNSATRLFRGEPVLAWTLRRLERTQRLAHMVVLCWEDQLSDVEPIAAASSTGMPGIVATRSYDRKLSAVRMGTDNIVDRYRRPSCPAQGFP